MSASVMYFLATGLRSCPRTEQATVIPSGTPRGISELRTVLVPEIPRGVPLGMTTQGIRTASESRRTRRARSFDRVVPIDHDIELAGRRGHDQAVHRHA